MAQLYESLTIYDNWILLGSPQQIYRAGLVIKQDVPMNVGDVAQITAEGEGCIHSYPFGAGLYSFPMFVANQVWAYPPGTIPPTITPLGQMGAGIPVTTCMGMDISQASNYYAPMTRCGAFKATVQGVHTFALYWWGGSTLGGTGNSATVYPGSSKMSVVVV